MRFTDNDTTKPFAGCLSEIFFTPWGFKALVPKAEFIAPDPVVTKFLPGHDYRMLSSKNISFEIHFSQPMDCDQITNTIQINSTTANGEVPQIETGSVQCSNISAAEADHSPWCGAVDTTFIYAANLVNVSDGIHQISVNNVSSANGTGSTGVSSPISGIKFHLLIINSRVSTISWYVSARRITQWSSLVLQITVRACFQ